MGELRSLMVKTSNLHPNCFLRHKFMLKPNLNLLSLLVNNYRSILWWHGKQTGWDDPVIKKRKKMVKANHKKSVPIICTLCTLSKTN